MVRSLYFDTLDDTDFIEKSDGLEHRRKIRLRIYSADDTYAKLEMKEKQGENQRKRSLKVAKEHAMEMAQGDYRCLCSYQDPFAEELYLTMYEQVYIPRCIVEYRRTAFIVPENDIRITFDANLSASESSFDLFSAHLNLYPVTSADEVTLEVKFRGFLLSYIKDLIASCNKMQISNSKYCLGRKISYQMM